MRDQLRRVGLPDHLGLAYDAWAPTREGKVPDGDRWLSDVAGIKVAPDYKVAFLRWKGSFGRPGDLVAELTLQSRLLVGHGNPSATDVGLTVHNAWGVPIIPGSSLKGIVAHYVDASYGPDDPALFPWDQQGDESERARFQGVLWDKRRIGRGPGDVYRALFGAPDARDDDKMREHGVDAGAAAGLVTFHDALYVPGNPKDDSPFAVDVLTVHQKSYYNGTGESWPNDFDDPNPVAFITVRPGARFLLALSGPDDWTNLASKLLAAALRERGVGGKTSAGYGVGDVGAWKRPPQRASENVGAFLGWIESSSSEQRQLLAQIRGEWLPRLGGLGAADREEAARVMKKRITSPKLKTERDALVKKLMEAE